MGRWAPGARGRLQEAAFRLFTGQGYEQTTVAEIAARAGLTERTFFRHFTDKREVLFAGQEQLGILVVDALAATDPQLCPLDAVTTALSATEELFRDTRDASAARQEIIDVHPDLKERELIKMARLAGSLAGALADRGVPEAAATLAADTGVAVFGLAFTRWVRDDAGRGLGEHIEDALAELRAVVR